MNYIGSKRSLLDFLRDTIARVTGRADGGGLVFGDLFAGTGVVGAAFKERGWKVIANDIQYYGYILAKHYAENREPMNYALPDELNALEGKAGFVYDNYCGGSGSGRNYFTDRNGMKCDAIRMRLQELYDRGRITEHEYVWCLASLINSIDKRANTASVYCAFLKHTKKSAQRDFVLEPLPVVEGPDGKAYNRDANELVREISGDVLYLDPPYNSRQYCSNYHVLETIARYDAPEITGVAGLRKGDGMKSRYCSKRTAADALDDLIGRADFKYIFLSYNNEGIVPPDVIREIMSGYGEYGFYTKEYRRFKADREENRRISADSTTEYLHYLIKRT